MSRFSRADVVDIEICVHHETELALLVSEDGDKDSAVWVPKSQIEMDLDATRQGGTITVPEWLATEKGLI